MSVSTSVSAFVPLATHPLRVTGTRSSAAPSAAVHIITAAKPKSTCFMFTPRAWSIASTVPRAATSAARDAITVYLRVRFTRKTSTERYRSGRNGGASKASCRVTGTWVRIPPSPPSIHPTKSRYFDQLTTDCTYFVPTGYTGPSAGSLPPSPGALQTPLAPLQELQVSDLGPGLAARRVRAPQPR